LEPAFQVTVLLLPVIEIAAMFSQITSLLLPVTESPRQFAVELYGAIIAKNSTAVAIAQIGRF
jgi:hypothetical protein